MKPLATAPHSSPHSPGTNGDILVVEDDESVAEIVATALGGRGFNVVIAPTAAHAFAAASQSPPDVVVLDLGLPDMDGVEVCRSLRRWFPNPIIVLSADGAEDRKIAALDEGADDYVTKPFSMGELLARINVAQRHQRALRTVADPGLMHVGDVVIDVAGHSAMAGTAPLELTKKEFALLALLAGNVGKLVTHGKILRAVWGVAADGTPQGTTESLRVHVTQLRRKLGDGPDRPTLETAPGAGYRMVLVDEGDRS